MKKALNARADRSRYWPLSLRAPLLVGAVFLTFWVSGQITVHRVIGRAEHWSEGQWRPIDRSTKLTNASTIRTWQGAKLYLKRGDEYWYREHSTKEKFAKRVEQLKWLGKSVDADDLYSALDSVAPVYYVPKDGSPVGSQPGYLSPDSLYVLFPMHEEVVSSDELIFQWLSGSARNRYLLILDPARSDRVVHAQAVSGQAPVPFPAAPSRFAPGSKYHWTVTSDTMSFDYNSFLVGNTDFQDQVRNIRVTRANREQEFGVADARIIEALRYERLKAYSLAEACYSEASATLKDPEEVRTAWRMFRRRVGHPDPIIID